MDRFWPTGRRRKLARNCAIWISGAATCATFAGCSSSDETRTGTNGAAGADVAEATSVVAKYQTPMMSFGLPPLKSAPAPGKRIAMVVNNIPESQELLAGMKEGAAALGWTPIPIVYDPTSPTGLTNAYAQAVEADPDGVVTMTVNKTDYAQAAKQLAARNIPLVTSNNTDPVEQPIIANVTDREQYKLTAAAMAAYIIAQKGADADVAMFNIPSFPILKVYESAFKAEYFRLCPDCKYKSVNVQAGDIGTRVPMQVVSAVQTDPSINFAVMAFGAVSTGVSGALASAGRSNVKIVGSAPALSNIKALAQGTEDMWIAYPLHGVGWKSIDALARYFSTADTAISTSSPTPFQILTKANISSPAELPEVLDYQASFKKLWRVG